MHDQYPNLLIGIGASAGGLPPSLTVIDHLSFGYQGAVFVAMHRSPNAPTSLLDIFRNRTRLHVRDACENDTVACTHLYVADADEVLTVEGRRIDVRLDAGRLRKLKRIDDLFASIAESAGPNAAGVILSGALADGIEGIKAIRAAGGKCLVQNPTDALFPSMPRNALEAIEPDLVGSPLEIASYLIELAAGRKCH
jgi:two-component system chemotaxis response regulator CheB